MATYDELTAPSKAYVDAGGTLTNNSTPDVQPGTQVGIANPLFLGVTANGTYGTMNTAGTVITNSTPIEKYIPEATAKLDTLSQKGGTTGNDGTPKTADGGTDVETLRKNNGTFLGADGKNYYNYDSSEVKADAETDPTETLINDMRKSIDSATAQQIAAIQQQMTIRKNQQKDANMRAEAGRSQSLLMGGTSRYAQDTATGIQQAQDSYGIQKLAELDAEENSLIAQARSAQQDKNFQLMGKLVDIAEAKRKEKAAVAAKEAERIAEENKKINEEKRAASRSQLITDTMLKLNTTDPLAVIKSLNGMTSAKEYGVTMKDVTDIAQNLKNLEKQEPGIIGEYLSASKQGLIPNNWSLDDYYNWKEPNRALEYQKTKLEIQKLQKEINGTFADGELALSYAQEMASTGKLPTGVPKEMVAAVRKHAMEMPKTQGEIVARSTNMKSSSVPAALETGYAATYSVIELAKQLKELDKGRWGGVVAGSIGKIVGSDAQQKYIDLRTQITDLLARARSGAALTTTEEARYAAMLPGRTDEPLGIGADSQTRIDDFIKNISDDLENKLSTQGLAVWGFSKVNVGGKKYTVGDTIQNAQGQVGQVNANGTITLIE